MELNSDNIDQDHQCFQNARLPVKSMKSSSSPSAGIEHLEKRADLEGYHPDQPISQLYKAFISTGRTQPKDFYRLHPVHPRRPSRNCVTSGARICQ